MEQVSDNATGTGMEWKKWPDQWSALHEEPRCHRCGQPLRYVGSLAEQHVFECATPGCLAEPVTRSDVELFGEMIVDGWRIRTADDIIGDRCPFCGEFPYQAADGTVRCTDCSAERRQEDGRSIWRLPLDAIP